MNFNLTRYFRIIIIFILLLIMVVDVGHAESPFIFAPDIKSSMRGIGKTVFHGTKIEEFEVEIVDIISGENNIGEFILARLNGRTIKDAGGISAGMSGSPVYIEGKLIGAISYTWELSEHNLCLITPIEEMLKLFDLNCGSYNELNNQAIDSQIFKLFTMMKSEKEKKEIRSIWKKNTSWLSNKIKEKNFSINPVATPIAVNGLSGRSLDNLSKIMGKYNLRTIKGFNESHQARIANVGENADHRIEPGSAIGIGLTRGDVNISVIGTTTYRQGDKIIALGHPFMKRGNASYFLSSVYIYQSLPNIVMPFKIGSPVQLVGRVSQDREAGIVGILNSYPRTIPLKINVRDTDKDLKYQMGVQLVDDDLLLEPFVSNMTIQAVDNALNSIGKGSAQVEIRIGGMKEDHAIFRENMFYSLDDIAMRIIEEIPEAIALLTDNYFKKVNLTEINIDIRINKTIKRARIEKVKLKSNVIKSGNTLEAKVVMREFRGEVIEEKISFVIPPSLPDCEATLIIRGGGIPDIFSEEENYFQEEEYHSSLMEVITEFSERPRNNQVVGEIIIYNNGNLTEEGIDINHYNGKEEKKPLTSKIDTDLVVEGYMEVPFTISKN